MKKGDKFLIISIAAVIIISFVAWAFLKGDVGTKVVVSQNNKVVSEVSLFENNTIKLSGNTVKVKNGKVLVLWANCKNQICVNHKPISNSGETIVCLPHKLVIEITDEK